MDYSIDDPIDFIYKVEEKVNIRNIIMMPDIYVGKYIQLMGLNYKTLDDIDDDERGSLWICTTDKQLANSYNIEYEGKMYIVKFHNINNIITQSFHKRKRRVDDDEPELNDTMKNMKL